MEKPNTPNNNPKMPKFNMTWIYILIAISIGVFFYANNNSEAGASVSVEKDYTTFVDYVEKGYGTKVVINNNEKNLKMYINIFRTFSSLPPNNWGLTLISRWRLVP